MKIWTDLGTSVGLEYPLQMKIWHLGFDLVLSIPLIYVGAGLWTLIGIQIAVSPKNTVSFARYFTTNMYESKNLPQSCIPSWVE